MQPNEEEGLLRSAALQTANTVLLARKRVEQELRAAKEELERKTEELAHSLAMMRATLESTTDGILVTDYDANVTDFNQQFVTMWRVPAEVLATGLHQQLIEITRPQLADPDAFQAGLEKIYAERPPETHDLLLLADGRVIKRVSKIQRIGDRDVGRVWSFRDITKRIVAEAELRQQSEWLRVTLGSIGDAVITVDNDCHVTFLNPVAEELTGWMTADAVGRSIGAVLHLVDEGTRQPATNPINGALEEGALQDLSDLTILVRRDGREIPIEDSAAPIKNPSGKIIGAVMVFHDVTERRQKERALQEEYAITEHLYEIATSISTELDLDKVVQTITDAGTRVTRAQFGAFFYNVLDEEGASYMLYALSGVPRSAFEKFPMPRATAMFGPTFRGEGVIRLDDVHQDPRFGKNEPFHGMPKGHLPVVSYLAVPVISRSGAVLGGLFFGHEKAGVFKERDEKIILGIAAQAAAAMDVAQLYQAEQQARASAEQANQSKDLFLAALSHELRTPLTPVLAILSSLREDAAISDALAEDLETVRRNVELEARLIDDLLDLTRISRGKLELHCERIELGRIIEDAIGACRLDLEAKHLELIRDFAAEKITLLADSARLTQIFWNLLKNAIKFTPNEGRITIRAGTEAGESGSNVLVEFQDTGIGIDPANIGRVFDAFEQGDRRVTRQFGGIGLGLAISKAIAESHQGTLTVESAGAGCGATFQLTLPFEGCQEDENVRPPIAGVAHFRNAPASAPTSRPQRILLVEDHADTAAILVRLLRRMGHDVIHADTVTGALKLAEREMTLTPISLVMSDLGLPDGSGLDLMTQLSSKYGLRGIALSGFGMDSDLAQSTAAGFSRHLVKPIDIATLRATIAEMTNGA
ncbi:MAG: ATP-binding protein [Chthoniobacterales bacterium]